LKSNIPPRSPKRPWGFRLVIASALLALGPIPKARALDLRLDEDAWALGMGDAAAASAGGTHAALINPAGIARATVPMAQLGGVFRQAPSTSGGNLTLLYPTPDGTTFGLTLMQDGASGANQNRLLGLELGLPLQSNHDLLAGFSIKSIDTRIAGPGSPGAHGLALDMGLDYDDRLPNGDALSFGLVAKNITGSVRVDPGYDEDVSRSFIFAVAYQDVPRMRVEVDYEAVDRTLSATALKSRLKLGVERFLADRRYSARVGWDDVLNGDGFFTLGGGYHPNKPYEVQAAFGVSEKNTKLMGSLSVVYRLDEWRGRDRVGEKAGEIQIGDGEEPTGTAVPTPTRVAGRPVSGVPLRKLQFSVSPPVFSPNGDGQADTTTISLIGARPDGIARWEVEFLQLPGKSAVKRFDGNGPPPPMFVWDGSDDAGKTVKDGRFEVVLRTYDPEGALGSEDLQPVEVRSAQVNLALSAEPPVFSPNRDGVKDRVTFKLSGDPGIPVAAWELEISDAASEKVVYSVRGKGKLPKRVRWDGLDRDGQSAPDAVYMALMTAEDKVGNPLKTSGVKFTLDTTAPILSFKPDHTLVSFDAKPLRADLEATDRNGIASWKVMALDEKGRAFRTATGVGEPPAVWTWNGEGDQGGATRAVPGDYFQLAFEAQDVAGNRARTGPVGLQVDQGASAGTQQMSLNLATIFFAEGTSVIDADGLKDLRGAVESIRPYLTKSVLGIKGYTSPDESGDTVQLSHARAAAVRDFLAKELKLEPGKITAIGLSGRDPLATPAGKAPNEKQRRAVVTLYTTQ